MNERDTTGMDQHTPGPKQIRVGLVCSHGGHLTEMLCLLEACADQDLFFATYHSSREKELARNHRVYALDNIGTNPIRLLRSLPAVWRILRRERPDVLVSTGSEIAIPFFLMAKGLGIKTIFVESWCRVHTPSRTGKVLYPLADSFLVQWPQLRAVYGAKARYVGGLW